MSHESKSESLDSSNGIPLKASKPGGSSIRMTRSKEFEKVNPNPTDKMPEENQNQEEQEKKLPQKAPMLKPKLPPKKAGGLPNLSDMKAKKPMALPPKKPAEEPVDEKSESDPKDAKPEAEKDLSAAHTEAEEQIKTGEREDPSPIEKTEAKGSSGEKPEPAEKPISPKVPSSAEKPSPTLAPGPKPKLTPKVPVKPKPTEEGKKDAGSTEEVPEDRGPSVAPKPSMTSQKPTPPKAAPPKPHVVQPGASTAKSQPTQGGAAVTFDTSKKRASSGVSAVGLAVDVLACVGALAIGYLILSDILKVL